MLVVRIFTAVTLAALLFLVGWQFGTQGLISTCGLVAFVCCFEYSFFVQKDNGLQQLFFIVLSFLFYLFFSFVSQSFLAFLICFIILSFFFLVLTKQVIEKRILKLSEWLMGIIYCGGLGGMVTIGIREFEIVYFVALFLVSFGTDTFAFAGGKAMGRTKLLPKVSPNKTLEGSLWGLLGGTGVGVGFLTWQAPEANIAVVFFSCLFASCFTQIGDLFESLIKRYSGVKDSGRILPGHGGILDRIDGLLFAGPFMYIGFLYHSL